MSGVADCLRMVRAGPAMRAWALGFSSQRHCWNAQAQRLNFQTAADMATPVGQARQPVARLFRLAGPATACSRKTRPKARLWVKTNRSKPGPNSAATIKSALTFLIDALYEQTQEWIYHVDAHGGAWRHLGCGHRWRWRHH